MGRKIVIFSKKKVPSSKSQAKRDTYMKWAIQKRKDHRAFLVGKMGGRCVTCGSTDTLFFHYKGTNAQGKNLNKKLKGNLATLLLLIPKYELLCKAHYHGLKHKPIQHGTMGGYTNRGCRCALCREVWNEYTKQWHRARSRHKRKALELLESGKLDKIFL